MAAAYRLWRFTFRDKKNARIHPDTFSGLPCPAAASLSLACMLVFGAGSISLFCMVLAAYLMCSRIPFVHFGRVILKEAPKFLVVTGGAALFLATSYLIKTKDPRLTGSFILFLVLSYFVVNYYKLKKFRSI
jgi:phosphatidylserine synthase